MKDNHVMIALQTVETWICSIDCSGSEGHDEYSVLLSVAVIQQVAVSSWRAV